MLKYYTRTKSGQKNGCLLAVKQNNRVAIGFSKCMDTDSFDKEFGTEVAYQRALNMLDGKREYEVPQSMKGDYIKMYNRSSAFFKGCRVE